MRFFTLLSTSIIAIPALMMAPAARAQDDKSEPNRQRGAIELERTDKRQDGYSIIESRALQYFDSLQSDVQKAAKGALPGAPEVLDQGTISYLTAAYLYCAARDGVCPFLLDAVLESDLMRSKITGKVSCPNTSMFWKMWVAADMEERHKYMMKITHLNLVDSFRKNARPRYIKCDATINGMLEGSGDASKFFANRYSTEKELVDNIAQASEYLKKLKDLIPNIYDAVGVRSPLK